MAIIQKHHIVYEDSFRGDREWVVELGMLQHRCIARIQQTKATPQAYADLTNYVHAVTYEWNRMRQELDTGQDLRTGSKKKAEERTKKKEEKQGRGRKG